jgi:hypothetical protein
MFQLSLELLLALLLSVNLPGVPPVETLLIVVGVLSGLLLKCSYCCFIPGVPVLATVESLLLLPFLLLLKSLFLLVFPMIKIIV